MLYELPITDFAVIYEKVMCIGNLNMIEENLLQRKHAQYQVSVDEYKSFRQDGYLVVRGLVAPEEVRGLAQYTGDLMAGRFTLPGIPPPADDATETERRTHYERVHMPHRTQEIAERYLLHPRVVDVLEGTHWTRYSESADYALLQATRAGWTGFPSGFVLHPHSARFLDRRLDCD